MAEELHGDPDCISNCGLPENALGTNNQLVYDLLIMICGRDFWLLYLSKDTANRMLVICACVLSASFGVIAFGWLQFVQQAAS